MQHLTSTMGRLAVVFAAALTLGSCNRAEYATLPRSASYMGTATATQKARVAVSSPIAAAPATAAPEVAAAPVAEAPVAAPAVTAVASAAPEAPAARVAAAAPRTQAAAAPDAVAAAPKLNLAQRIALAKVTKKLNKLAANTPQLKKGDNTAHTARINGNLRTGIILLLVGLIVGIFSGLIGTIIALIGVIFLVLWLLDEL
jgi:hypothetical protein